MDEPVKPRRRRRRTIKALEPEQTAATFAESAETSEVVVSEDVVPPPEEKPSFADRFKQFVSGHTDTSDEKPTARRPKPKDLQPILSALFVLALVLIADRLLSETYKPIAPTTAEAAAVANPIANIIIRRLDIRGKLSPDAADILAIALAVGLYGQRALGTVKEIHAQQAKNDVASDQHGSQREAASANGAYQSSEPPSGATYRSPNGRTSQPLIDVLQRDSQWRHEHGYN